MPSRATAYTACVAMKAEPSSRTPDLGRHHPSGQALDRGADARWPRAQRAREEVGSWDASSMIVSDADHNGQRC